MSLPNWMSGGFVDADVVAERLRHLVHAVEPFEQRHRHDDLRLLAVALLQLAPYQQVEFLIGAAELHVALQRHGVVALHQRIQEFVDGDRLIALVALREIVALEHARDRVPPGDLDEPGGVHAAEPARIEIDARLFAIEDLEDLLLVGLRVRLDLFARQRRPRRVAPGRIADHSGEVADQERDLVPEILELPHLVDEHGVPEMQIGRGRIESRLDPQRLAAR